MSPEVPLSTESQLAVISFQISELTQRLDKVVNVDVWELTQSALDARVTALEAIEATRSRDRRQLQAAIAVAVLAPVVNIILFIINTLN